MNLFDSPVVAIDTETTGLALHGPDQVFGISVSAEGHDVYFDIRENSNAVYAIRRDLLKFTGLLIGHNIKFDAHGLYKLGIDITKNNLDDTMIRAQLLNEHLFNYDLDTLGERHLGIGKIDIIDKLAGMFGGRATKSAQMPNLHKAPADFVGEYAIRDTRLTYDLWHYQEKLDKLPKIHGLEKKLIPVLIRMERLGVRIDEEALEKAISSVSVAIKDIQAGLNILAGFDVNVNSGKALVELFKPEPDGKGFKLYNGAMVSSTRGGAPCFNAEALGQVPGKKAEAVLKLRKYRRILGTFLTSHIKGNIIDGRIHPWFNQCSVKTGRLSCLAEGELVLVGGGYKTIEDIKSGDTLWSTSGPDVVTNSFYVGVKDCVRVGFNDGKSIVCTLNHRILTTSGWRTINDIISKGNIEDVLVWGISDKDGEVLQPPGQFSNCDEWRTSFDPRRASGDWETRKIQRIVSVGHKRVYDISVKKGKSYVAGGVFNHNCTVPPLQGVPKRDPFMKEMIRPLFLPEAGYKLLACDYAQSDVRGFAHYISATTDDHPVLNAYKDNPMIDFHQYVADILHIERNPNPNGPNSKQISLAMIYSMGAGRLAKEMGMKHTSFIYKGRECYKPGREAMEVFNLYHDKMPGAADIGGIAERKAIRDGFVTSIAGRKLRFPDPRFCYKASGYLYQSFTADLIKMAMVAVDQITDKMHLSIHDELIISIKHEFEAADIKEAMEAVFNDYTNIPIRTVPEWGDNWYDLEEVDLNV